MYNIDIHIKYIERFLAVYPTYMYFLCQRPLDNLARCPSDINVIH